MIPFILNGLEVRAEEGWTLLEAARFYGLEIPTLCWHEGLTPYGAAGSAWSRSGRPRRRSSSRPAPIGRGRPRRADGHGAGHHGAADDDRAPRLDRPELEEGPGPRFEVQRHDRPFQDANEECILCGLCVRMCAEQMNGKAIGFQNRGAKKKISTPFDIRSEECGCAAAVSTSAPPASSAARARTPRRPCATPV